MRKSFLIVLSCLLFFAPSVYGKDGNLNIVFIPKSSDQDFWVFMRDGVDKAVREAGNITLTWRGPAYNDDTDSQIKIVQAYIRPGVDAIVIAPTDQLRLVEPVRKASALGIKIIVVDSTLNENHHQSFVTTDNFAAGQQAAKHLSNLLNGQGNVAVLRTVAGSGSTDDRARGFISDLKEHSPKISIVADEYGGGSKGRLINGATKLLNSTSKIDGIFAVNETATDGMLRALRGRGLAGKVKFVGFDSTDFLLDGLEKGEIDGLIIQNPRQMGYLAIKAAVTAINGASAKEKNVFTDTTMVTRENFKDPGIRSLLVP